MIASLRGKLLVREIDQVVIDVGGVGYQVHVSLQTLTELPAAGAPVEILCFTHVREDALQLYGFLEAKERRAFELLKSVSGVGPKLALTVLSGMPTAELFRVVADGNLRSLCKIPGIGKKTGERLILELKERFSELSSGAPLAQSEGDPKPKDSAGLVEALVGLGYKRAQADRAITQVFGEAPEARPEELLRRALALIQEQ